MLVGVIKTMMDTAETMWRPDVTGTMCVEEIESLL